MMADCGCGKNKGLKYEVTLPGQTPVKADTASEALSVLKAAGNPAGSGFKAVGA